MCRVIRTNYHAVHTTPARLRSLLTLSLETRSKCCPIYSTFHNVCMYVCMYACMYTYIHTCIHTYLHTCIPRPTYVRTYIHAYIHAHMYHNVYMHNNMHNVYMHVMHVCCYGSLSFSKSLR